MDLRTRVCVFSTFLGSCLSLALLVSSLSTDKWAEATATRPTPESEGRINLGLFFGKKELNVAYGWRTDYIHVIRTMRMDHEFLIYWYWLSCVSGLALGIFFAAASGICAVVISAGRRAKRLRSLYVTNGITVLGQCISIGSWLAQFFLCLRYNMLTQDDKKNAWTSDGQAQLGSSFWFVVISAFTSLLNICLLLCVSTREKETENIHFTGDEKINAAIMLY